MAYTTINKQSAHFNTKLYTGTGSSNAQTGVGFQPDFTWIKSRDSSSYNNLIFDAVRGATKYVKSDANSAENTLAQSLKSFDTDGFTVGTEADVNNNSTSYVAWNWKAAGSSSSNSNGSVTSTVSANTTSGFSIVKWTGTGANATIGHGLGVVPKMIIVKDTDANDNWNIYHASIGNDSHLHLNLTNGNSGSSTYWQDYTPTNSIFYIGSDPAINASGNEFIAYCFADITGFSKFGKFTSKGDDDGVFVNTGFAPQLVMLKPLATDTWSNWYVFDNVRRDFNLNDKPLYWNLATREAYYGGSPASNYAQIDILSNGFKIRRDGNWGPGASNQASVYMAFGQTLVGSNNVPVTAR